MNLALVLLMVSMLNNIAFESHLIDTFPAGYQVAVADINGDGRLDIAALSTRQDRIDWYENGTWRRHPTGTSRSMTERRKSATGGPAWRSMSSSPAP